MKGFGSYHKQKTETNRQRILNSLMIHGPLTQRQIAKITGLHRTRVTKHVEALVNEGSIVYHDKKCEHKLWYQLRQAGQDIKKVLLLQADAYVHLLEQNDAKLLKQMQSFHIENPTKKDIGLYLFCEAVKRQLDSYITLDDVIEILPPHYTPTDERIISWYSSLQDSDPRKRRLIEDVKAELLESPYTVWKSKAFKAWFRTLPKEQFMKVLLPLVIKNSIQNTQNRRGSVHLLRSIWRSMAYELNGIVREEEWKNVFEIIHRPFFADKIEFNPIA